LSYQRCACKMKHSKRATCWPHRHTLICIKQSPILNNFFFNDPSTTEIYTLSLHDALPIFQHDDFGRAHARYVRPRNLAARAPGRSEEHTSELQSRGHLVCRLLLEKKKRWRGRWRWQSCRQQFGDDVRRIKCSCQGSCCGRV